MKVCDICRYPCYFKVPGNECSSFCHLCLTCYLNHYRGCRWCSYSGQVFTNPLENEIHKAFQVIKTQINQKEYYESICKANEHKIKSLEESNLNLLKINVDLRESLSRMELAKEEMMKKLNRLASKKLEVNKALEKEKCLSTKMKKDIEEKTASENKLTEENEKLKQLDSKEKQQFMKELEKRLSLTFDESQFKDHSTLKL